ncbi:MAG: hypothetical protein M3281_09850 [Chloroflexota bacterium]|nr:hypothetical protein [Chloroflexota bacterium]
MHVVANARYVWGRVVAAALRDLLLTHQSYFAGNHSLVVVTPDTSGSWRVGLEVAAGKVLPATAIYIDAISFDPRLPRLLPQVRERGGRFTSYMLRNGDDIAEKLSQSPTISAAGAPQRQESRR